MLRRMKEVIHCWFLSNLRMPSTKIVSTRQKAICMLKSHGFSSSLSCDFISNWFYSFAYSKIHRLEVYVLYSIQKWISKGIEFNKQRTNEQTKFIPDREQKQATEEKTIKTHDAINRQHAVIYATIYNMGYVSSLTRRQEKQRNFFFSIETQWRCGKIDTGKT